MSQPSRADVEKLAAAYSGDLGKIVAHLIEEDGQEPEWAVSAARSVLAPETNGSSALAPVVKITGKRRASSSGEPLTELGYARRLVDEHGRELRYVVPWNRWLVWDGKRWAPDTDGYVQRCMKLIARHVHTELIAEAAEADMIRAAKRAESSSGVKGALTLAATEPEIAIVPEQLDAHWHLLNCRNGIVDLRTGQLRDHDPALLLTPAPRAPRSRSSSRTSSPARTCGCSSAACSACPSRAR
jgi:hypothetical protein